MRNPIPGLLASALFASDFIRPVHTIGPNPSDKRGRHKSAANASDMAPVCGGTREIERRRKRLAKQEGKTDDR